MIKYRAFGGVSEELVEDIARILQTIQEKEEKKKKDAKNADDEWVDWDKLSGGKGENVRTEPPPSKKEKPEKKKEKEKVNAVHPNQDKIDTSPEIEGKTGERM